MTMEPDLRRPFSEFAEQSGDYYSDVFLKIQKSTLDRFHINKAALLGSFVWAALRGNWTLFVIGFAVDLIAVVNLSLVHKYTKAAADNADKDFLVQRYEGWSQSHLMGAIVAFVLGRLIFAWVADRLYANQYSRWRVNREVNSGVSTSRLILCALITLLIFPMMIYRSTQFAPDERTCIRQDRAMAEGEAVPFKDRFDCFIIGEFPTLFWIERPDDITFPRDDAGNRIIQRTPPNPDAPPVNLNTYVSEAIDNGIAYLTVFYGFLFDGITQFLRGMLSAITSVFVGTPWPITMCALLFIAYKMAGTRTTIFVGASLIYLAVFGFWQTAMDTMSLVVAASIICVVAGLPLGIWVGKSARGHGIMTPILDVMQTIPSFVYLLPAIAFFSIGKPPGILATVIFAMPPMVRLTALGIRHVPENTKEAALAFGANPRQLLTKVELPLALPSIMTGINQVVMMSLSMVVIAALIGAGGMGYIVTEALEKTETGRGVLAGIGIALLAMMIDRVVQKANRARH
ncbi:Glycine betaine/proline betaine transport system permease protein ProW [Defluviimonas aquaemixtae]|uniref:Glycine betaine/proline betaine transport system permease protein ProW n=1 Tax=Albidovulum aquaemixtae TaxID=1542388 RepID=A0A2R8B6T0_9RHOB|nr:ABC transporter permease subunit [Defluviimonas aquaemixtae]SPH18276.1 Glycine betaine/proline betaine transport system permease protein ProW [Defluviimonas aquaemixtae]